MQHIYRNIDLLFLFGIGAFRYAGEGLDVSSMIHRMQNWMLKLLGTATRPLTMGTIGGIGCPIKINHPSTTHSMLTRIRLMIES